MMSCRFVVLTLAFFLVGVLNAGVASASLPTGEGRISEDARLVQSWTEYLNTHYKNLQVTPKRHSPQQLREVIRQLDLLEDYLQGSRQLEDGKLDQLACKRCVCEGCAYE